MLKIRTQPICWLNRGFSVKNLFATIVATDCKCFRLRALGKKFIPSTNSLHFPKHRPKAQRLVTIVYHESRRNQPVWHLYGACMAPVWHQVCPAQEKTKRESKLQEQGRLKNAAMEQTSKIRSLSSQLFAMGVSVLSYLY